jgi:hypothetical protein
LRVQIRPIVADGPKLRTSYAHGQFHSWALGESFKRETFPAVNGFVQRVKANAAGIEYRRTREGRFFLGMIVEHYNPPATFP